ncbi:hypothetical protein MMC30_005702 [Trapelia coarctata]|nr:hypothetical protein [Trapelia coarctata]
MASSPDQPENVRQSTQDAADINEPMIFLYDVRLNYFITIREAEFLDDPHCVKKDIPRSATCVLIRRKGGKSWDSHTLDWGQKVNDGRKYGSNFTRLFVRYPEAIKDGCEPQPELKVKFSKE